MVSGDRLDKLDAQVWHQILLYLDHNISVEQLRQYIKGVMWRTLAEKPVEVLFVQQTEWLLVQAGSPQSTTPDDEKPANSGGRSVHGAQSLHL